MADLVDELLSNQESTPGPSTPPIGPSAMPNSIVESVLSGRDRQEAVSSGPGPMRWGGQIIDSPDYGASNLGIARASLAVDDKDKIKRYAEHFGQPESDFGVIDGEVVRWDEKAGGFAKVVPSISGQTSVFDGIRAFIAQWANISGPTAPEAASTVTGTLSTPLGPWTSIAVATATASATDWARQALDKALADEPLVPGFLSGDAEYDYLNMLGHGALGAFGQGMGVMTSKLATRNPMGVAYAEREAAMDAMQKAKWQALEAEAKRRGVTLSMGQKTGLRTLMAKERQLLRWDETADMVSAFRDDQRLAQIPAAMLDEIRKISPRGTEREFAINAFREGADTVIEAAQKARAVEARIYYGASFIKHKGVDSPWLQHIWNSPEVQKATAEAARTAGVRMQRMGPLDAELGVYAREAAARGQIEYPAGGVARGLSLKSWDRIQRALTDMWKAEVRQDGSITAYGGQIKALQKDVVEELYRLTGGRKGLYYRARLNYGQSSEVVDMVLDGGVGVIQRMKGPDRVAMVQKIFGGRAMVPEEIARTRDLFIKAGQGDAWNAGLAQHLSQVLDDSIKSAGMTGNVPGQIYSRLGRDRLQHDTIVAAMDTGRAESFEKFLEVLNAASRALPEGSPTATDLGAMTGVGKTGRAVANVLSPQTYMEFGTKVLSGIDELRSPAQRLKLAKYLLSEEGSKALAKFRMPSKLTEGTIRALYNTLTAAGLGVTGQRDPDDFVAPRAAQPTSP